MQIWARYGQGAQSVDFPQISVGASTSARHSAAQRLVPHVTIMSLHASSSSSQRTLHGVAIEHVKRTFSHARLPVHLSWQACPGGHVRLRSLQAASPLQASRQSAPLQLSHIAGQGGAVGAPALAVASTSTKSSSSSSGQPSAVSARASQSRRAPGVVVIAMRSACFQALRARRANWGHRRSRARGGCRRGPGRRHPRRTRWSRRRAGRGSAPRREHPRCR